MINEYAIAGKDENFFNKMKFPVFNEAFEIKVRHLVANNIDKEFRADGETAFVIKDFDVLIVDLIDFILHEKSEKRK
jgi:hypothetical protein